MTWNSDCSGITDNTGQEIGKIRLVKTQILMTYIYGKINLPLVLNSYSINLVKWWVEVSFGVHPYMIGHIMVIKSLVNSVIYFTLRENSNTKSLTETEVVGTDAILSHSLWT